MLNKKCVASIGASLEVRHASVAYREAEIRSFKDRRISRRLSKKEALKIFTLAKCLVTLSSDLEQLHMD